MESKSEILNSIRRNLPQSSELPDLDRDEWIRYDAPCTVFAESLQTVGGRAVPVQSVDEIARDLESHDIYGTAQTVCSTVDGLGRRDMDLAAIEDPHDLESIDLAIVRAEFGVAENAAVWITDRNLPHRTILFIAQHLAIVLNATRVVSNMHQAYQRLEFGDPGFGVFISGPSKTADIEQSLVIGAHGPRSTTVYLLDESDHA